MSFTLTYDIPQLEKLKFKNGQGTRVKKEYFMPKGLKSVDHSLPKDYWESCSQVIKANSGSLVSSIKQIHHLQICPSDVSIPAQCWSQFYHPGEIFSFGLILKMIECKSIEVDPLPYLVHVIDVDLGTIDE